MASSAPCSRSCPSVIATAAHTPRALPADDLAVRIRPPAGGRRAHRARPGDGGRTGADSATARCASRARSSWWGRFATASDAVLSCGNSLIPHGFFANSPLVFLLCALARACSGAVAPGCRSDSSSAGSRRRLLQHLHANTQWRIREALGDSRATDGAGRDRMSRHGDSSLTSSTSSPIRASRSLRSGNVVFTNPEGRIAAERVEFNVAKGTGTFHHGVGHHVAR